MEKSTTYVGFTAKYPHMGKIKELADMPFIDLVDEQGEKIAQLYLFRFCLLQVSHDSSDSTNNAGSTWSSVYFESNVRTCLLHADYQSALCIMRLLIEKALYEQSHRKLPGFPGENKVCVFRKLFQDQIELDLFAQMCLNAYRAHNK